MSRDFWFVGGCVCSDGRLDRTDRGASRHRAADCPDRQAARRRIELSYFAVDDGGTLKGWSPDLGTELARRAGVTVELVPIRNPADMIDAFKTGRIDATFIGITKDRAAAFDFGPVLIGLRTTFLVPASSTISSIPEVDQAGVRIVVPARSAQGEHLEKILTKATMLRVPVETTKPATDLIASGQADAFSHVVPMLAQAQPALPGSA